MSSLQKRSSPSGRDFWPSLTPSRFRVSSENHTSSFIVRDTVQDNINISAATRELLCCWNETRAWCSPPPPSTSSAYRNTQDGILRCRECGSRRFLAHALYIHLAPPAVTTARPCLQTNDAATSAPFQRPWSFLLLPRLSPNFDYDWDPIILFDHRISFSISQ